MSARLAVEGVDSQGNTVTSYVDIAHRAMSGFGHGEQVTRDLIGPTGPLTPAAGFSTTADGAVYENLRITGQVVVRHDTTLRNCEIIGLASASSAGYTVKHTQGAGKLLTLERCRVVARSPATKVLTMYGAGGLRAWRTIFDGGTDNAFVKPEAGSYPGLAGYSAVFEECVFGRLLRSSGSHNDCVQIDSDGGSDGGCLVLRCRLDSHCCPGDPYTTESDATRGGTALIITGSGASKRVDVIDCWADGGNISLQMQGGPGTSGTVRGCRLGLDHQYRAILTGNSVVRGANVWAATGRTNCCGDVRAGQPVTG